MQRPHMMECYHGRAKQDWQGTRKGPGIVRVSPLLPSKGFLIIFTEDLLLGMAKRLFSNFCPPLPIVIKECFSAVEEVSAF